MPSIIKTADLVQEITAASEEQASGAGQINSSMEQLNKITQHRSSSSEELAATSEEMSSQAEQLQQLMNFFKLSGSSNLLAKTGTDSIPTKSAAASGNTRSITPDESEFVKF